MSKNYYLVECYYGDVSNVLNPIAITTNYKKGMDILRQLNLRGIVTRVELNKVYNHTLGAQKHWHRQYRKQEKE